jgi:hypothetical protein
VADAGLDLAVKEGSVVALSGGASFDPDSDALTYSWTQTGGPAVELNGDDTAAPSFTAPLLPGGVGAVTVLTFQLEVSDTALAGTDDVTVIVEQENHAPIADAGEPRTVFSGAAVTMNAGGSRDPDNDPLHFQWTQVEGPTVTMEGAGTATPTFTAPPVGSPTSLAFDLTVSDGQLAGGPDRVVVTVVRPNDPPQCHLAQATPSGLLWPPNHKMVSVGLTGISDPNGDGVSVVISRVTQDEPTNGLGDGDTSPDAVIQGNRVLIRSERSGRGNGRVYEVHFTATDALGAVCEGSVLVKVPHSPKAAPIDDGQFYDATQP